MDSWQQFEAIAQFLTTSSRFDVKVDHRHLIATRRRPLVPRRGVFRLLIPCVRAIVTDRAKKGLAISVQPDSIAIFMVLMLLGGVATELLMSRVKYPRAYPPEFIYGLAALYIGTLIAEMIYTWKQLRPLLDRVQP
jgi:hypothetical protein